MAIIRAESLRALCIGQTLTESVPGRGNGAILFERVPSGLITATYRYSDLGKRKKFRIGIYREKNRDDGLTLNEIRERVIQLAKTAKTHGDLSQYYEGIKRKQELLILEEKRAQELLAARGTISDLFEDYLNDRSDKAESIDEMKRIYKKLLENNPEILNIYAAEAEPWHIKQLITPIYNRGAKIMAERTRRFISAAFNYGIKSENYIGRPCSKSYNISSNPAAAITIDRVERKIKRALSEEELSKLWHTLELTDRVGPIITMLIKFIIATGGQRVTPIINSEWPSYDLENKIAHLNHSKGRGGATNKRDHPVPLNIYATEIMNEMYRINGGMKRPWTTRNNSTPISLSSLKNAINRWLQSEHAFIGDKRIEPFTARDLRRTCTQLMAKYGIDDRSSDEIQAHGIGGIVNDHYRNNPMMTLPRRKKTMVQWQEILERVILV